MRFRQGQLSVARVSLALTVGTTERRGRLFNLAGELWLVGPDGIVPAVSADPLPETFETGERAAAATQLAAHLADCFPSTAGRQRYADARRLAQRLTRCNMGRDRGRRLEAMARELEGKRKDTP